MNFSHGMESFKELFQQPRVSEFLEELISSHQKEPTLIDTSKLPQYGG